jgi:hypothetical protein
MLKRLWKVCLGIGVMFFSLTGADFNRNGFAQVAQESLSHPINDQSGLFALQADKRRSTIPYSGRLIDASSQNPADGLYDFIFTLYDQDQGGVPLWSEDRKGVRITRGEVRVGLGMVKAIPPDLKAKGKLWVSIEVKGQGENGYSSLSPRQVLTPVTQSVSAALTCPHSHLGDVWDDYTSTLKIQGWYNAVQLGGNYGIRADVYGCDDPLATAIHGITGDNGLCTGSSPGKGVIGETQSWNRWTAGVYANYDRDDGIGQAILTTVASPDAWAGWFTSQGHGLHIEAGGAGKTGLEVLGGTKSAVVQSSEGLRLLYTEESTAVWFTDYGFGKLKKGEALIPLNALFAETVNLNDPYHVFIQSYGNAELYVSERTPTHFKVKSRRGKPNTEFSFRIVAKRLGYERAYLDKRDHAKGDASLVHQQGTTQHAQSEAAKLAQKTGGLE